MSARVAVIGEGLIDRFVRPSGTEDVVGGSPLNTAVALVRAGVAADWWNRVSTSPDGQSVFDYAVRNNVAGRGSLRVTEPAAVVTIALDQAGVPTYQFALEGAADWGWDQAELAGLEVDYDIVQIGSLTTVLQPGSDALMATIRGLRARANAPLITFDPNARPKAANSEAQAAFMRQRTLELVPLADLVKVSDEDLEWLVPDAPPTATATAWSTLGPKLVVMTKGAEGSAAFAAGVKVAESEVYALPLVDTVGAGDTYMGWLLRGIVTDHACQVPSAAADVQRLLDAASHAAGITCSRAGCNPPTYDEVMR